MLRSLAIVGCIVGGVALADPLDPEVSERYQAFAEAVSSGDAAVLEAAQRYIADPPTTLEEIGFYGLEAAPPEERALRGIIRVLDDGGFFVAVEDKYVHELLGVLVQRGAAAAPEPSGDTGLLDRLIAELMQQNAAMTPSQVAELRAGYWGFAEGVEEAVVAQGNALLQIKLPIGDTLYYWVTSEEAAADWRGRVLYEGPNSLRYGPDTVTFTITSPDWEQYWGFLTYAFLLDEADASLPTR